MLLIKDSGIKPQDSIIVKLKNGRESEAEVIKVNVRSLWSKLSDIDGNPIIKRKYRHIKFSTMQYTRMRIQEEYRKAKRI